MASARGMVQFGRITSPLAHSDVSIPMNANTPRIMARPNPAIPGAPECAKFAPFMKKAPTATKITRGSSFSAVAAFTRRAPCATPPMLIRAMPPIAPTMVAACTAGASEAGTTLATTSARAAAMPPQASRSATQNRVPAMYPVSGPKLAAMYP